MKTLEDLRAIREKAQRELASRSSAAKYRISVAMGTCGIAAGARNVMSAILDELNKRNVTQAVVTQTGCLGYCDQEPMVQVTGPNNVTITYGKVTPEAARRIVDEHIQKDSVVSAYVFKQG
ncbi:MAG: (2Fe-2S) ferredoxin domain-containing protein [candidate division KSB1 bacterium]|nr:(2Fe-2S) ferredoxin domain-containing protein [candidate division KSB1 bacterium]